MILFAAWTLAHQAATAFGLSWTTARTLFFCSLPLALGVAAYASMRLPAAYAACLPSGLAFSRISPGLALALQAAAALFFALLAPGYAWMFAACLLLLAVPVALSLAGAKADASPLPHAAPQICFRASLLWLGGLVLLTFLVVTCANRSDFDDAEYIQLALQTIRHPDLPLYSFDASLGFVLDKFRFAPYRFTSYETLLGLISQTAGVDIVSLYYIGLPGFFAVLSVLAGFLFLRWFLPLLPALLALTAFVAISLAWGETHVAYANRMFVRLFQGKGLLVTLSTPLTILFALLWMRTRRPGTLLMLFVMQVAAIGFSSSGIVITVFATLFGAVAGFLAAPGGRALLASLAGCAVLLYPVAMGLWIKYTSTVTGVIEDIGTPLPINASFGGNLRQALALSALCALALVLPAGPPPPRPLAGGRDADVNRRALYFLLLASFVVIFNPLLAELITRFSARNMSWRLAWAVPAPLLLAMAFTLVPYRALAASAQGAGRKLALASLAFPALFLFAAPWALAPANNVTWGFFENKVPEEHRQAIQLGRQLREEFGGGQVTLLVDPRIGTWLTVTDPDIRLVLPGHGYWVTLKTIMNPKDFEARNSLIGAFNAIVAGDRAFDAQLDAYGVNAVAVKQQDGAGNVRFQVIRRAIPPSQ